MRRTKKVKILPYKQIFREAKKKASKGIQYAVDFVEFFEPKMKVRKNELKKRDVRSNKQRRLVNEAVEYYKESREKEKKSHERERQREESLVNNGTVDSKEDARNLISLFAVMSIDELAQKLGLSSEEIVDLYNEYDEDLAVENIRKVAEWVQRDKEMSTPSYLKDYLQEDDAYRLVDLVLNIMKNEEISQEDLEMAFSGAPTKKWRERIARDDFDIGEYLDKFFR